MKHVICPGCGGVCIKYGYNKSGSQRWYCRQCRSIITPKIDNSSKQLKIFLAGFSAKILRKICSVKDGLSDAIHPDSEIYGHYLHELNFIVT